MYFFGGGVHVSFRKCNLELPGCTWLVAWFVALLVVTKSIGGYPLVHVFVDPSFSLVSLRFQHGVYQKNKVLPYMKNGISTSSAWFFRSSESGPEFPFRW